ncbi:MAG: hypothetical protein GX558_02845 [Clostridiales bacterium]|nr:hypothetical protein [Clostridiales bacterium]
MKGRRSVFRRHAGRAFLRFLIGLLLLFIVCALAYMFLTQWGVTTAPTATASPSPAPTPTAAATPSPTPAPLPTAQLSARVEGVEVPAPGDALVLVPLSKEEFINTDTQTALVLSAYAFMKGEDAAQSTIYVVVDGEGGPNVYDTRRIDQKPSEQYDAAFGTNLDQTCFTAAIDMSGYPDGQYDLGVLVVNGDRAEYMRGGSGFAFALSGGELVRADGA